MKKALYIILGMTAMLAFVVGFDLAPGLRAADKTISLTPAKDVTVGGLPVIITFQSSDVGTADSVVVDGPPGFYPDYVFATVPHTTGSLIIACEWFKGMGQADGSVIANNGTRAFTLNGAVSLDEATGNMTFGAECHTDDAPFAGWAIRYAE